MEVILYHAHRYKRKKPSRKSKILFRSGIILGIVGIVLLAMNFVPLATTWVKNGFISFKSNINLSSSEAQKVVESKVSTRSTFVPQFDPRLPHENRLIIPTIGVTTEIQEATYDNYESALKQGVWRVSNFGDPASNSMPTILAAHRYGYLAWSNLFRRQNSFFNLPKLAVGDTVQIYWMQRKYTYEVYAGAEGDNITDYSADLILYTCVDLTGSKRIFRYARLLEI